MNEELIIKAYESFNARKIEDVLDLMSPDVKWPNGWEGGYLYGREAVKDYWVRQWKELEPNVTPVSINEIGEGEYEVEVQQLVKDLNGNVIADGLVKHFYFFENGLIAKMEIVAL